MPLSRAVSGSMPAKALRSWSTLQPASTRAAAFSESPTSSSSSSTASARASGSVGTRSGLGSMPSRSWGGWSLSRSAIASPSRCTDRRMAAAGLFSSCARPAASVPSPASFSRWRTNSSSERSRSSTVRTSARAASGPESSSASRPSRGMRSTSTSVTARTDACRSVPCSAAISPWMAPGPNPGQRLLGRAGALGDLQLAADHHEHGVAGIALRAAAARRVPASAARTVAARRSRSASDRPVKRGGRAERLKRHRSSRLQGRQVLVHELDGHGALADRAGDALDGPMSHVAGDEDARACSIRAGTARGPGPSRRVLPLAVLEQAARR